VNNMVNYSVHRDSLTKTNFDFIENKTATNVTEVKLVLVLL